MKRDSPKGTVCVTGAAGFIGSWLVMKLLEKGYTVRATVRDPENIKKTKHLLELQKAKTNLTLWKADLTEQGSFDEAIEGCAGVFHVETPMDFESKDPEIMVDNIMLVCKYGDERLAIESESYPSYEKLIEVIVEKWVNLRYEQVNLSYATPVLDKFLLKDSVDFRAMLRMASIFDMKYMEIDVKSPFAKKDMLLESGPFKNSCHVISNDEPSSSSCVSSETSIVVHSSIGTPLLSAYWGMGLSHVGQTFPGGRIEFRDALAKYSIDGGFSVGFKRNDKQFVIGFCKTRKTANTDCPWFVRASICSSNGYFIIREFVNCHTCDVRLKREESKQLSSKLVARLITKPLVGAKRPWNPSDVMYHMKQSYGQELDYKIAWNALSKAKEQLYGDEVSSYQQLWWYTRAATEMNPGSKIVLELEERTNTFKRIFLAWGACIEGFKDIRPMLFLDGTFLKGKFQGVLLSATGKNANQELYPLAYAIVDGETKENWEWFMSCLREVVGYDRTITFISDRNEGLLASIQTVFQESPNFFCMRHLQDNIKGRYTGMTMRKFKVKMVNLLTECAKATTFTDFQTCYTEFRHAGGKIVDDFLVDMPLSKWTNLYAGPGRYGEMTSNGAESFNNWIMDARELPITQCIDKLRQKLMEWFVERRTTAAKWNGHVCPIMEKKLKTLNSEGRTWRVKNANHLVFEVFFKQTYSVDLKNRRCSCNVWQLDGFPCSHAVACVNSLRVYRMQDYIDDYWFVDRYRRCYEKTIMPIPNSVKEQYMFVNDPTILPPKTRSRPGRRAKRRIRSKGEREDKKLIQCSRCKKLGSHNKKTCTARI